MNKKDLKNVMKFYQKEPIKVCYPIGIQLQKLIGQIGHLKKSSTK